MAHRSAHLALLSLERSSAPPVELLDEVARILGVEFDDIRDELFKGLHYEQHRHSILFAPKEEWTLRWLLKKTKAGAKTPSSDSIIESTANDDPRKWLLFYYLIYRTPVKQLAKILREQNAVQQVQDALGQLAKGLEHSIPTISPTEELNSDSHKLAGGSHDLPKGKSKKRKRSPVSDDLIHEETSTVQIVVSILRALKFCLDESLATDGNDHVSQQHMRIALSLAPEKVATVLEYVFRVVTDILTNKARLPLCHELLNLLGSITRLWGLRHGPELGHACDESNQCFTSSCLLPSLSLLNFMRTSELRNQHKDLEAWLEKMIALHAVERARKVFFDELASKWKSDQDPLLPEHIKLAVQSIQTLLLPPATLEAESADSNGDSTSFSLVAPILLEIAIRSCPGNTVRKAQQQPWLEALFVCLAHLGGCSLVKEEMNAPAEDDRKFVTCLVPLLNTAIQWKMSLSLPLLSSLASKFDGLQQHRATYLAVMPSIMQLDVNVFLPNSGLSTAQTLLDQLLESLDTTSDGSIRENDLALDRDSLVNLVSLLIKGFASARDLVTFTNIWMDQLAVTEDARISSHRNGESVKSYSLWDDEDLVVEFAKVAKTSATSNFIEKHLLATTQALRDEQYGGKHYALIVVLGVFLSTHKGELETAEQSLRPLSDVLQDALQSDKGSSRMRGWLWRLLRYFLPYSGTEFPLLPFNDLIAGNEPPIIEAATRRAKQGPRSYFKTTQNFSEVERFHCLVAMTNLQPSVLSKQLDVEIDSLNHQLSELRKSGESEGLIFTESWNGKAGNLASHLDLSTAFLGILLQNSQILCHNVEGMISLMKTLALHIVARCEGSPETQSGLAKFFEGLLTDEALVSTPGFVKNCIKTTGLMDASRFNQMNMAIIQALPREAMSKAQRKQIAEWQNEMFKASVGTGVDCAELGIVSAELHSRDHEMLHAEQEPTYGNLQKACKHARAAAALLKKEDIISQLDCLRKEFPNRSSLLLLGSILNKGETISAHATGLVVDLSTLLPKPISLESFCLTADCIKIILDKHHESVNQWTIDSLLASLAITTTNQGPDIPNAAPIIFARLCRLLGVILGRYRIRLGGRYHLLLPVLYGLLRCLFAPDTRFLTTQSQILFYSKLPSWIRSDSVKLSKDSSTHLTRLLTSICDPTPSSVKRTHNFLTDQTKKARDIAGQYMQYFIAEYAHCQLNGRIEAEAKAALMPGLYAVLDVMGKEVMRGMNAKMDASQKAIFKGLYEDYTRFGRWNGM